MPVSLSKVAAVIDAAADHFDAIEREKQSAHQTERAALIEQMAGKYAEATGEEMPKHIRQKLAQSDKDVVDLITSMATKQASQIEAMGAPSTRSDNAEPQTAKEASEQADSRFLNWVMS